MSSEIKLSPTQKRMLRYFRTHAGADSLTVATKKEMASALHVTERTIERGVMRMRQEGIIEVVPRHAENGGQLANGYRIVG